MKPISAEAPESDTLTVSDSQTRLDEFEATLDHRRCEAIAVATEERCRRYTYAGTQYCHHHASPEDFQ